MDSLRSVSLSGGWRLFLFGACAAACGFAPGDVRANPAGGTVVGGVATISSAPNTVTIRQTTDRAVINWPGFSIGAGETTQFLQPGATSAVLNRVTGGNPSALFGSLQANGQVYLINPNGILVGSGANIRTQSFVASTLDVDPSKFMAGGDLTFQGGSTALVQNFGHIEADGGDVILVGRQVVNQGTIEASNGTVGLAAGNAVLFTAAGDQRVHVLSGAATGGTGVDNQGTIRAAQAELKAAGGSAYALAVNVGGLVSAQGVANRGGKVYLTSAGGNINVTGAVQARKANGQGGEIYAGGGAQGKDAAIDDAANVTIAHGATLSAGGAGDTGGTVIVWSNGATRFDGAIETGAGGHAEVSGHDLASFTGTVNTRGGLLLIDPTDLTVNNSNFAALVFTPLLTQDVVLQADNDITWETTNQILSSWTKKLTLEAGNDLVFVSGTNIVNTSTSDSSYLFQAGRDVVLDPGVSLTNSGGGDLLVQAGRNVTIGSQVSVLFGLGSVSSITLVADSGGANPSATLTVAANADTPANTFRAATIRAFVPQASSLAVTGDNRFLDAANNTIPMDIVGTAAFGDAGTAGSGVYTRVAAPAATIVSGTQNVQEVQAQVVQTAVIQPTVEVPAASAAGTVQSLDGHFTSGNSVGALQGATVAEYKYAMQVINGEATLSQALANADSTDVWQQAAIVNQLSKTDSTVHTALHALSVLTTIATADTGGTMQNIIWLQKQINQLEQTATRGDDTIPSLAMLFDSSNDTMTTSARDAQLANLRAQLQMDQDIESGAQILMAGGGAASAYLSTATGQIVLLQLIKDAEASGALSL